MTSLATGGLAVAVAAVLLVCGAIAADPLAMRAALSGTSVGSRVGMMPEVVSIAESPRLVMPTVEVHAFRSLAVSDAATDVY